MAVMMERTAMAVMVERTAAMARTDQEREERMRLAETRDRSVAALA